jgi:PhzF family phenazine biosynthesis protein
MFCPALGIPEDPVSGNAHGLLGAYLVEHKLVAADGAAARFVGAQGHYLHRPGRVHVELEFAGGKLAGVWIVGHAVQVFETVLDL